MPDRKALSRSTEDYLKTIYKLESQIGRAAQTSAIADALEVAPPSVSGMMKRLSELGYVEHAPYHGVQLTPAGRREALRVMRRHRILETYLIERLGYTWDSVHEEAERLEHAVSDLLVDRMAAALGNPRFDPHGDPIPTAVGDMEEPELVPLSSLEAGTEAELRMVGDQDPERLRFLGTLGLKPGARFTVIQRQPFNGPVTVRLAGSGRQDEIVGFELASSLGCSVEGD